ncbi:hypothetical protein BDV96DRAFT_574906 [Lophiotrema nucula]|uniref:Trimethyllysine dioxygenase n=1 Tax=Lophiotrema nucula TaxID=690887 RepID=A0A6A5Z971_9PLEO|nr:hypothetical protein BDV96DRAFT_574906 [Lophiotrema nucula]
MSSPALPRRALPIGRLRTPSYSVQARPVANQWPLFHQALPSLRVNRSFTTSRQLKSDSAAPDTEPQEPGIDLPRMEKFVEQLQPELRSDQFRPRDLETKYLETILPKDKVAKMVETTASTAQLRRELDNIHRVYHLSKHIARDPLSVPLSLPRPWVSNFKVQIEDGRVSMNGIEIPNIWLRDNCQCSSCMHADTKQRLLDTFDISADVSITSHENTPDGIRLTWSDGHTSEYTNRFIGRSTAPAKKRVGNRIGLADSLTLWDSSIASFPPIIGYSHLASKKSESATAALKGLLSNIRRFGFSYIDGVPADPRTTKSLLERIAFIRTTHYGGFYDFTADLASKDTAYTNIALGAHTDNTYFSDPAGLQAFHLLSHTDGSGGASLLVDGFKIAQDLKAQDRDAYEILSLVMVHAHASGNQGISIQPYRGFPVLQHDLETGYLLQLRWNTSDRARIELPIDQVGKWYDAARKWDALVKKKENEYWEQLRPGRVLIFDNWRVMHGRSAFTGKRRICGGYINRDDWISKFKILRDGQESVLEHLATD